MSTLLEGVPYEEYDKIVGLRASGLKHLKRSPAHYIADKENPREPSDEMNFGKLFHSAMENPEKFLDLMVVEPLFTGFTKDGKESAQSGEAKQKKKEWYAALSKEAIVIPAKNHSQLVGMVHAVRKHKIVGNMIKDGVRETTVVVTDPATGQPLKCRPDVIAVKGYLIDYKTTRDASPSFFLNQIFSDRGTSPFYVLGAAHYTHCARIAQVARGESFVFVAIEKTPPFGIMVYPLDRGQLEVGESHRAPLTRRFANCVQSGEWPSYDQKAFPTEIPEYVKWPDYVEDEEV